MNVLGYTTAAKVFGWIAMGAGIAAATPSLIIKNFASTAEKTTPIWQRILGGISAVGAIANNFAGKPRKKRSGMFQTVDQAARWIIRIMNPLSIGLDREINISICERTSDGAIIFGPHDIGDYDSSTALPCPSGTKRVGTAHAHAAARYGAGDEVFSDADRINANRRSLEAGGSVPNYIGTPRGQFKKFKPSAIRGSTRGRSITLKPL